MKTLLWFALTMAFGLLQTHGDLVDFREMIEFETGKNAEYHYDLYGCYCGFGGHGSPKDETDWCCAEHDCCYRRLQKRKCDVIFQKYKFEYQNGTIVCGDQDYCRRQLCECDKAAASCFGRYLSTYQEKHRLTWFCPGRSHQC